MDFTRVITHPLGFTGFRKKLLVRSSGVVECDNLIEVGRIADVGGSQLSLPAPPKRLSGTAMARGQRAVGNTAIPSKQHYIRQPLGRRPT